MKFSLDKKSWWLLVLGLLYPVTFRIWGIVRLGEVVAILLGFWAMMKYGGTYMKLKSFRTLIILYCLCLFAIPVSDLLNHTATIDAIKGFGTFAFLFPFFFASMWLLSDDVSRIKYFVLTNVIAQWIIALFLPSLSYEASMYLDVHATSIQERLSLEQDLFAYRYTPLVLIFLCFLYKKHKRLVTLLMLPIAVFFLFGGSRSYFLVYCCSAILLLMQVSLNEKNKIRHIALFRKNSIYIVIGLMVFGVIIKDGYSFLAKEGYLGIKAQWKYETQAQDGNIMMHGRAPFFIGLYAASKEPIWGYGSYARDEKGVTRDFIRHTGINEYSDLSKKSLIPTHSHIIYYWVCNGIMTLPFWIYIIYLLCCFIFRGNWCYSTSMAAYYVVSSILLLWNIFFSPFQSRLDMSFTIIAVLVINLSVANQFCRTKLRLNKYVG